MNMQDLTDKLTDMKRQADQLPLRIQQQAQSSERLPYGNSLTVSPTGNGVRFTASGPQAEAIAKNAVVRTRKAAEELMDGLKL